MRTRLSWTSWPKIKILNSTPWQGVFCFYYLPRQTHCTVNEHPSQSQQATKCYWIFLKNYVWGLFLAGLIWLEVEFLNELGKKTRKILTTKLWRVCFWTLVVTFSIVPQKWYLGGVTLFATRCFLAICKLAGRFLLACQAYSIIVIHNTIICVRLLVVERFNFSMDCQLHEKLQLIAYFHEFVPFSTFVVTVLRKEWKNFIHLLRKLRQSKINSYRPSPILSLKNLNWNENSEFN